jgi:hypothetical protein
MDDNKIVFVVGFDKYSKRSKAVTSCCRKGAQDMAKYYRSIGYNARVLSEDEWNNILDKEHAEYFAPMF